MPSCFCNYVNTLLVEEPEVLHCKVYQPDYVIFVRSCVAVFPHKNLDSYPDNKFKALFTYGKRSKRQYA